MSSSEDDPASGYFDCSDRERAAFEAGIKLGTVFHQFVGTPFSSSNVGDIEKAIVSAISTQPCVESVSVHIVLPDGGDEGTYRYFTLSGDMLDVKLCIRYAGVVLFARMRYVDDLEYPLMYIEKIE